MLLKELNVVVRDVEPSQVPSGSVKDKILEGVAEAWWKWWVANREETFLSVGVWKLRVNVKWKDPRVVAAFERIFGPAPKVEDLEW